MPILKDLRGVKKITLPGYPDSEVEIYDTVLFGQAQKLGKIKGDMQDLEQTATLVKEMIKDWNFTDDRGEKLPVTIESISTLSLEAITYMGTEIAKLIEGDKKKD